MLRLSLLALLLLAACGQSGDLYLPSDPGAAPPPATPAPETQDERKKEQP